MTFDDTRMPWERHPQPWTDVVVRGISEPTRVHCGTCRCDACTAKQPTRLIRAECEECGCLIRITRIWIKKAGLPTCGCGGKIVAQVPKHLAIPDGMPHKEFCREHSRRAGHASAIVAKARRQ